MSKVVIYGKNGCQYCTQAKTVCEIRDLDHQYLNLNSGDYELSQLEELVGAPVRTLPQVFIDGQHVGGFDQMVEVLTK